MGIQKNTNDSRESAAIYVAKQLLNEKAILQIYDPKVSEKQILSDLKNLNVDMDFINSKKVICLNNPYDAAEDSHAIAILTEWDEFIHYDWKKYLKKMKKPAFIFDGRNILDRENVEKVDLYTKALAIENEKTILVTGGAGFIGSHLCNKLLSKNNKVICVDNLFTGSKENIFDLLKNPDFNFIEHDIIDPLYIDEINEIYNLACPASPLHYQENPIKTIKTCTIGTINILGLAKKNNAKVLQASTSEVYGDPQNTSKMKAIMEMLILLATGLAMMRERDVLRRYSWIIIENTT